MMKTMIIAMSVSLVPMDGVIERVFALNFAVLVQVD
jgi:hypothetical protein